MLRCMVVRFHQSFDVQSALIWLVWILSTLNFSKILSTLGHDDDEDGEDELLLLTLTIHRRKFAYKWPTAFALVCFSLELSWDQMRSKKNSLYYNACSSMASNRCGPGTYLISRRNNGVR